MSDIPETAETRTSTLIDRPPVTITEDAWPVIAHGQGHDWSPHGQNGEYDANRKWRCDIRVRRSIGARLLVYGNLDYETKCMGERDRTYKAGVVIEAGDDVVAAIRKVAAALNERVAGADNNVIRDAVDNAISELRAEQI